VAFYAPPLAQANTIKSTKPVSLMRKPNIKVYDRPPVKTLRVGRVAPETGNAYNRFIPIAGLGQDTVDEEPSGWASGFKAFTEGLINLGTKYLEYDSIKDDAKASERKAAEEAAKAAAEKQIASEDMKMIEWQRRMLEDQQFSNGMPKWIIPAAIAGGVGVLALVLFKSKGN